MALVDNHTMQHFAVWVHSHVAERHQEQTVDSILGYLSGLDDVDYRFVTERYSWREIEELANRTL